MFYNKTLLEKLTGLSEPPGDLRAFLDVCRKIGLQKQAGGQPYIPIASSAYHAAYWFANTAEPLTYPLVYGADYNRDGDVGEDETGVGLKTGRMSLNDRAWRARFALTRELAEQFQPGFVGLGRDEAVFLFMQERAVFMHGDVDVGSLVEQAKGKFEVGVANFPQPAFGDKEYGGWSRGRGLIRRLRQAVRGDEYVEACGIGETVLAVSGKQAGECGVESGSSGWIPAIVNASIPPELARLARATVGFMRRGTWCWGRRRWWGLTSFFRCMRRMRGFRMRGLCGNFLPRIRSAAGNGLGGVSAGVAACGGGE